MISRENSNENFTYRVLIICATGLILATPLLAVAMVLIQTIYMQDVLGDKPENLPEDNTAEKAINRSGLPSGSRA